MAYLLIITTQSPYHRSSAIDAYEAALAATNMGIELKFLFVGDGVYQLKQAQAPESIGHKSLYKKLKALPLFDVEEIYVAEASLQARDISMQSNEIDLEVVSSSELSSLYASASQILEF